MRNMLTNSQGNSSGNSTALRPGLGTAVSGAIR